MTIWLLLAELATVFGAMYLLAWFGGRRRRW